MQVLMIDAFPVIDRAVLQGLYIRGHEVAAMRGPREAADKINPNEFDCILIDLSTTGDGFGLVEMRLLVRSSAVALMTTTSVESLVAEALAEGSIEFSSLPGVMQNIEYLSQPALLVDPDFHPALTNMIRDKGLRVASASTLQFVMNLLVDGWCQIVCLNAEIPGRPAGKVAIVHRIGARELAILAYGLPGTGITCAKKPRKLDEFLALLQQIAAERSAPCGLAETHRSPYHRDRA